LRQWTRAFEDVSSSPEMRIAAGIHTHLLIQPGDVVPVAVLLAPCSIILICYSYSPSVRQEDDPAAKSRPRVEYVESRNTGRSKNVKPRHVDCFCGRTIAILTYPLNLHSLTTSAGSLPNSGTSNCPCQVRKQ
jgi:hypothetical protein